MNARRVGAVSRRILQQFRRDRRTLALLFVAPILVLSILGYLLRGGAVRPAADVVNLDQGQLGAMVARELSRSDLVDAHDADLDSARKRLEEGRTVGYAVLPAGFSAAATRDRRIAPEIHLEGTQPGADSAVVQALTRAMLSSLGGAGPTIDVQVSYLHGGAGLDTLDYFGAAFIGLVVFFLVFVITSVSFLRERSQGTLERLMASPLRRGEIVLGYMVGFAAVAVVQGVVVLLFCLFVLRVHNEGNVLLIFLFEVLLIVGAVNLGIFVSAFARTEFQAVQFIPIVLLPQVLLSGVIFPVATEPRLLQYISNVLPLTYAVYGLRDVMLTGADLSSTAILVDLGVAVLFAGFAILAAAATLRRQVG